MPRERATVRCPDCAVEETFGKLGAARSFIDDHRAETGHWATWEVHGLDAGVERAGADAGVCGRPDGTTTDSPLFQPDE